MTQPDTNKIDECQKSFEEWCERQGYNVNRSCFNKDRYSTDSTRTRWKAWQAAWEESRKQFFEVVA